MISLLNTNVVIRFLIADKNPKYRNLLGFFESLEKGDIQVELKLIVLFRIVCVLKSFYKVPINQIAIELSKLLQYKGIVIKEKIVVLRTLELFESKNLEIVDCYLIASMEKDDDVILYSYDRNFDKFEINRIEP